MAFFTTDYYGSDIWPTDFRVLHLLRMCSTTWVTSWPLGFVLFAFFTSKVHLECLDHTDSVQRLLLALPSTFFLAMLKIENGSAASKENTLPSVLSWVPPSLRNLLLSHLLSQSLWSELWAHLLVKVLIPPVQGLILFILTEPHWHQRNPISSSIP